MPQEYIFCCPEEDCDFFALVPYIPATRWDPGCLDGDPPEECPRCGARMDGVEGEDGSAVADEIRSERRIEAAEWERSL
jgi:hypothetical protein